MDAAPYVIAHLSDLHVGDPDGLAEQLVGPRARLAATVERLSSLPVDAIVVTGDLVDHGTTEEYEALAEILSPWEGELVVLGGNHDDLTALREALGDAAPSPALAATGCWVRALGPWRIVALDTVWPGFHDGRVDHERIGWLDAVLAEQPEEPTLVCLHHPPVATGMWWMDYGGLEGADELEEVVARHPQIRRVLAGHIHRATEASWGNTVVGVAPSMSYQSMPALVAAAEPVVVDDPPTIPLLRWDGTRLVTHHLPLAAPSLRLDLRDVISPWAPYEAAARAGGPMPAR